MHKTYHITVNGYVQNVRMYKAVELLKNSDVSITQMTADTMPITAKVPVK